MGIDVSKAFFKANTVLNKTLGKYERLNIIGVNKQAGNALVYLYEGIVEGFYYTPGARTEGDITDELSIVPADNAVEEALSKAMMLELVNQDGSFLRFEIKSKQLPTRPSFQWCLYIKPNQQDKRVIL